MSTDFQNEIKTKEEYLESANITFAPAILKIKKVKKIPMDGIEKITFKRLDIDKDNITAEALTTGQTEVAHIKVGEDKKVFNKYIKGAQISQSYRNGDANKLPEAHSKVLRKYLMMWDKQAFDSENENYGVLKNQDPNSTKNKSVAISGENNQAKLDALIDVISSMKEQVSNTTASNDILLYVFGSKLKRFLDVRIPQIGSVRSIIKETWPEAEIAEIAGVSTDVEEMGLVAISQELVALNMVSMPEIGDQGTDTRLKEYWADYDMGSTMVDVEEEGALIYQPLTMA